MAGPTLMFGIGAAKAGTSWLWDHLYHHPQGGFRAVKELHYFDALENGSGQHFRRGLQRRVAELEEERRTAPLTPMQQATLEDGRRWLDIFDGRTADDAGYLDFIGARRDDVAIIGDVTPAYALLGEATFRRMHALADKVRFVFLMRDPLARMLSNIAMTAGRDATPRRLDALARRVLDGGKPQIAARSDYRATLQRLRAAVPREHVHLEFYERLFSSAAMTALCAFLGIADRPADIGRIVHGGRVPLLPEPRLRQMLDFLAPQYDFVADLMGGLPAEWTELMVKA